MCNKGYSPMPANHILIPKLLAQRVAYRYQT